MALVNLVTITWASPSPTRTSCRWIDEKTSINRCVVGRAQGRSSGYNGNVASPAWAIAPCKHALPLQQRLHQQGEEIRRQQTLDPRHVLQEHRQHREVGLELREPLFPAVADACTPVAPRWLQLAVIGQQREDAILGAPLARSPRRSASMLQCEPRSKSLLQVLGFARSAGPVSPGGTSLPLVPRSRPAAKSSLLGLHQDLRHRLFHLGPLAKPGSARTAEAFPQVAQGFGSPLDRPGTSGASVPARPCEYYCGGTRATDSLRNGHGRRRRRTTASAIWPWSSASAYNSVHVQCRGRGAKAVAAKATSS